MPRRAFFAAPLVLALLAACGGADQPAPPPVVTCGTTANSGTLGVGDQPTCGTATFPTVNSYSFSTGSAAIYSVTVWTTSGDADFCVTGPAFYQCSSNTPPSWVDRVSFTGAASTAYTVDVENWAFNASYSTYAIQVTSP